MNSNDRKQKGMSFSFAERLRSFRYAFQGMRSLISYEHNARIHLFILIAVIVTGILLGISRPDWMAILFVSGLVFVSECFNTAVEYLCDVVSERENENIRVAKDVAAAGVMISAIISVVTGLIIFLPRIISLAEGKNL